MVNNDSQEKPLSPPQSSPAPAAAADTTATAPEGTATVAVNPDVVDPHSRDLAIGAGVVIVLLIAFFFAKNAYAHMLVGRRIAPRSANAAGWWLFIALGILALAIVFGAVDANRFLDKIYVIPLTLIEILSIVLLVLSSRR